MARIQINDLPVLETLADCETKGIFGGAGTLAISFSNSSWWRRYFRRPSQPARRPISVASSSCGGPSGPMMAGTLAISLSN